VFVTLFEKEGFVKHPASPEIQAAPAIAGSELAAQAGVGTTATPRIATSPVMLAINRLMVSILQTARSSCDVQELPRARSFVR
jgi:hypothetical protein